MKIFTKAATWVFIVVIIYGIVLTGLFMKHALSLPNDLSTIFISLGTGLIAWLITNTFSQLINKEEKKREVLPHYNKTDNILEIVKEKYMVLKMRKRNELDYNFFKDYFNNAKEVKIMGIANKKLLFFLSTNDDHVLIESICHKRNIHVEILITDPESQHVDFRNQFEKTATSNSPCTDGIMESRNYITELEIKLRNKKDQPMAGSYLSIQETKIPLHNSLTYIKYIEKSNDGDRDIEKEYMLFGPIFNYKEGSKMNDIEIPKGYNDTNNPLFEHALGDFNAIFDTPVCNSLLYWG